MIQLKDKVFDILISEQQLLDRIQAMASQISQEYEGKSPLFLAVLNGSFMFAADLLKNITIPCEISFIKVASYEATHSTGKLTQLIGLPEEITGRHVIVLEDIVDTGITIEGIVNDLLKKKPLSVQVATLLHKPEAYTKQISLPYIGFSIPNQFVLGYGLDFDQLGRNLKDLYVLRRDQNKNQTNF
jgi:hypoxanthine phosphoribosyltransferase